MVHFGGTTEKCSVCAKTVYLAEKIVVEDKEDKKTFHKTCLKCSHCKANLSLGNYASMNGVMYCKPHFKQLFATKGNYDEGFGKEKLTSKWTPNATVPASAGSPSGSHAPSFVPVEKEETKAAEKKETPSSIASRFQKSSSSSEKCETCGKTVYATEKIVIEEKEGKKVYHKGCLRCSHCQVVLTLGNYASMGGVTYCKPHLKQLFATKGNYDEGFGKEKHTTKWEPQAATAPATFVPVEKSEAPKETKTTSEVANKFKNISASDKCDKCGKTVYLTEKIVVEDKEDKKLFHKACLRCSHCQVVLSLGNYASLKGVFYCKPHFKQLFAAKGNYDEGFGNEKHTAKWIDRDGDQDDDSKEEEARREKEERHRHEVEEQRRFEREERQRQETEERQRTEEAERRHEEEQRKLHEAEDERHRHQAEEQRRHEREERQREENEERQRMEENERRLEEVRLREQEEERQREEEQQREAEERQRADDEEPHHRVHQEDEPVQLREDEGGDY